MPFSVAPPSRKRNRDTRKRTCDCGGNGAASRDLESRRTYHTRSPGASFLDGFHIAIPRFQACSVVIGGQIFFRLGRGCKHASFSFSSTMPNQALSMPKNLSRGSFIRNRYRDRIFIPFLRPITPASPFNCRAGLHLSFSL